MPNELYKQQAKRLTKFLKDQRGLELRHSEALEAIAAVHGQKDWNTLSALGVQPHEQDRWCVTQFGFDGFPHVMTASNKQEGLYVFLALVHAVQTLIGDTNQLVCYGEDDDLGLTGLYVYTKGVNPFLLASFTSPMGMANIKHSLTGAEKDMERMPFIEIAAILNKALPFYQAAGLKQRQMDLANSWYLHHMTNDYMQQVAEIGEKNLKRSEPQWPEEACRVLWESMGEIRYQGVGTARVRAGNAHDTG